jgi:hypothetical protein
LLHIKLQHVPSLLYEFTKVDKDIKNVRYTTSRKIGFVNRGYISIFSD